MDRDVAAVVRQAQDSAPWELAVERHWLDRRCREFRINVWIWVLSHSGKVASGGQERRELARPKIDYECALEVIDRFVMNEPWGGLWDQLVNQCSNRLGSLIPSRETSARQRRRTFGPIGRNRGITVTYGTRGEAPGPPATER